MYAVYFSVYKVVSNTNRLVASCLQYFISIPSDTHREAWTMVMLMLMTKTLLLDNTKVCASLVNTRMFGDMMSLQFCRHVTHYYTHLCHMISLDLKLEVRTLLQKIYARIGTEFHIV